MRMWLVLTLPHSQSDPKVHKPQGQDLSKLALPCDWFPLPDTLGPKDGLLLRGRLTFSHWFDSGWNRVRMAQGLKKCWRDMPLFLAFLIRLSRLSFS